MGIERFLAAQEGGTFEAALAEIRAGGKRGHWIWFVFPQLAGLGSSPMSRTYGLQGVAEAVAYVRDPVLLERLLRVTGAVRDQLRRGAGLEDLMGSSIDALKLVSSMTLFRGVASRLVTNEPADAPVSKLAEAAEEILTAAAREGYPPCEFTTTALQRT